MNPLTKVKLINELNAREASLGVKESVSWHQDYKDSAWIFMGGLPYELTEGDIICVFSQYGEVVNINLVRDKATGRSKGFCFLCYEDQRSTVLAVDNLNGIKLKGRTIRVDHVSNYRPPKDSDDMDEVTQALRERGCGARTPSPLSSDVEEELRRKKKKKDKKKKKERIKVESSASSGGKRDGREKDRGESSMGDLSTVIKQERVDPAYDKYQTSSVTKRECSREREEERPNKKISDNKDFHRDERNKYRERDDERNRPKDDRHRERNEERQRERNVQRQRDEERRGGRQEERQRHNEQTRSRHGERQEQQTKDYYNSDRKHKR
ncbi:RNA-binding motif protein, X-linked 2 isoform X2 [Bombina bombina]|uniref:RNA-binding motif protein, X-linked 2 isoform X2 n=1 Tax=Bombina bombina TaxID=8345 RepID=UPI00235B0478|nr:RNA-binding motif protein, X-linked 2 isoform X2 [Bombina bombina]